MSIRTIKDIARQANVSYATVSRALNNKYGVKPETRERVLDVARELRYSPNAIARGLVTQQTLTLGLIIPDIENPFFPAVAGRVEDEAQRMGYSVFLCDTNWNEATETRYVQLLTERRVDGLIIAPIGQHIEEVLGDAHLPVVYMSNAPKGTERSYVVIDDKRGTYLATNHLIEAGYESIGFIGARNRSASGADRLAGYELALENAGRTVDTSLICLEEFREESGYRTIAKLIEEGQCPEAVVVENDLLALGVMNGARAYGFRIPEDLAIVGFDDIRIAGFPEVNLTTISQPKHDLGRIAVRILLDQIRGSKEESRAEHIILEPRLVVRGSSVGTPAGAG